MIISLFSVAFFHMTDAISLRIADVDDVQMLAVMKITPVLFCVDYKVLLKAVCDFIVVALVCTADKLRNYCSEKSRFSRNLNLSFSGLFHKFKKSCNCLVIHSKSSYAFF